MYNQTKEAVKEVTKKKRGSKQGSIAENTTAKPEEISKIVKHVSTLFRAKPVKSDEECEQRIANYFDDCYKNNHIPTVEGMALSLGTARQTLYDWEVNKTKGAERSDIIKRAKATLSAIDAELAASGKIPQIVYIFRAKNYYGMQDKTEVSLNTPKPMGDGQDQKALEEKYNSVIETEGTEIT